MESGGSPKFGFWGRVVVVSPIGLKGSCAGGKFTGCGGVKVPEFKSGAGGAGVVGFQVGWGGGGGAAVGSSLPIEKFGVNGSAG